MIKYINNNGKEKYKNSVNSTTRLKSPNSSLINLNSEKFLYPLHPVRCIITGPSNVWKSVFPTNINLTFFDNYDKIYIYSPINHQDLYQKLLKCLSNYIPIHIIPNILIENYIDIVFEKIVKNKDFEKSDNEVETYESIEELKYP